MEIKMKIAGTGGQGVMVTGKILGYAASDHNKFASFLPQYGTQQRGGTASCTVIVSDKDVTSPIVGQPNTLMIFEQSALDAHIGKLKSGGLLFINSNTCEVPQRSDIEVVAVPVDEMARAMGSRQVANIIMLGAFIKKTGCFTEDEIIETLSHVFESKPQVMPMNIQAIHEGAALIK